MKKQPTPRQVKIVEHYIRSRASRYRVRLQEASNSNDTVQLVMDQTNGDFDAISDLFLSLLVEINHKTLEKYMRRFFNDYELNGYKVEDTKLYGLY